MILDAINNWFNLSKRYFFTYSNGFFNLPYLSNSPEVIIKSCSRMPFMKHDTERKIISADTPFVKGKVHYVELEKGLWFMTSIMNYKNNVSYKPIYDNNLPADYYFITTNIISNEVNASSYVFDDITIENNSISFSKPKRHFLNRHFKQSQEIMYMLYFNEDWAEKNILNSLSTPKSVIDLFGNESVGFLNYAYQNNELKELTKAIDQSLDNVGKPDLLELKMIAYNYLNIFFKSVEKRDRLLSNNLSEKDYDTIKKIEYQLTTNAQEKFQGIETLAKKFKISPTKLKQDFKKVHGMTLFGYFQKCKMELALKYTTTSDLKIKEIAQRLGYENAGKFSQAFKKFHGHLPTEK